MFTNYISTSEINRKIFHIFGGLLLVGIIRYMEPKLAFKLILALACLFAIIDYANLVERFSTFFLFAHLQGISRKTELVFGKLSGATWMLVSLMTCLALNGQYDIVTMTFLIITISDPMAALCGILFGSLEICNNKTVEGMLAFFISSVIIITLYTLYIPSAYCVNVSYLYVIAAAATAIEIISAKIGLDDNFSVPLFSLVTYNTLCTLF